MARYILDSKRVCYGGKAEGVASWYVCDSRPVPLALITHTLQNRWVCVLALGFAGEFRTRAEALHYAGLERFHADHSRYK